MRLDGISFGNISFLNNNRNNNAKPAAAKCAYTGPAQDCFTRSKAKNDTSFYTFNDSFELSDYAYHKN